jgi:hypothetical protein
MILTRRSIEFLLASEVARAKEAFDLSRRTAITAGKLEARAGSKVPENSDRTALDAYETALGEFNDFIMRGVVPARLKEPQQTSMAAEQAEKMTLSFLSGST